MSDYKHFDAISAQLAAQASRSIMVSKHFRHYKGGLYRVVGVDVDEATGEVRVSYISLDDGPRKGWQWSRTLEDFSAKIGDSTRFVLASLWAP